MKASASRVAGAGVGESGGPARPDQKRRLPSSAPTRWAVAGAIMLLSGGTLALRQGRHATWPSVEATVQSVRVVQDTTREAPGGASRTIFRPEVRYRYLGLDARPQDATGWASRWSSDPEAARKFVEEFPAGTAVTIRQDPRNEGILRLNPRTTFLSRGIPWLLVLIGIACSALAWRSARRWRLDATVRSPSGPS